jgi:hypothetical protein
MVVSVIGNSRLTAIKSAGLPPMGKNSRFELFTKSANTTSSINNSLSTLSLGISSIITFCLPLPLKAFFLVLS